MLKTKMYYSSLFTLLMVTVICLTSALLSHAQQRTIVNPPAVSLNDEAVTAIHGWMITLITSQPTKLAAGIDNVVTTITVENGSGLNNKVIRIDNEAMTVTTRTGKTLTVTRGSLGTTPVNHLKDAQLGVLMYEDIRALTKGLVISNLKTIATNNNPMATVATKKAAQQTLTTEIQAAIDDAIQ